MVMPIALAVLLAGCRGKLVNKAELHAPGTATARFTARAGQSYKLWADTDGSWKGPRRSKFPAGYTIDVQQGGRSIAKLNCDTRNSTTSVCGMHSNNFGDHSADCEYALDCALPKLAPAEVVLRVEGRFSEPSRVKSVKDMSVVVRED